MRPLYPNDYLPGTKVWMSGGNGYDVDSSSSTQILVANISVTLDAGVLYEVCFDNFTLSSSNTATLPADSAIGVSGIARLYETNSSGTLIAYKSWPEENPSRRFVVSGANIRGFWRSQGPETKVFALYWVRFFSGSGGSPAGGIAKLTYGETAQGGTTFYVKPVAELDKMNLRMSAG